MDAIVRLRTVGAGVLTVGLAWSLSGCGASSARVDGAEDAGRAFEQALVSRDYRAACGLLAPETRKALAEGEKQACPEALEGQDLPASAAVRAAEVYGRQALVRAGGETLFLSQFAAGWRVVAAGCTPQGDKPYQCLVKGG
ncbi:hypothetical protein M5362_12205 [Streptomyces sp. Je 1-79]|uniref:hypothetical protein n=1 Tax=Streptomyces sp. Je 1-79 TaxID=2943847 RepID=UPI0021A84ED3|nr:hypothetical protein [Streptomyces sp. Je 1-79]MCT4353890.1 hypothetical protein [Streptomyces sp. Je 1-79]